MNVLSLFSGIGSFEKALKNIGIDCNIIGFSEIDKYAIKSYCAIHSISEEKNLGDVSKIDLSQIQEEVDIITHGSPCQDFSIAGKQAGAEKGSGTRSSLMWFTVDIVEKVKPKYVIWENVKNLLSKRHKHNFDNYIEVMDKIGYNSYFKILNAKDQGIPQNRERIYTISIRKDIDKRNFEFPKSEELKMRLKDILEKNVEEKYYLSEEKISKIVNWKAYQKPFERVLGNNSISPTLTARGAGEEHSGMITYSEDLENTTNLQEKILINNATKKGFDEAIDGDSVNLSYPNSKTKKGRVGHQVSQTLTTNDNMGVVEGSRILENKLTNIDIRIRKLTPKECWRLMRIF